MVVALTLIESSARIERRHQDRRPEVPGGRLCVPHNSAAQEASRGSNPPNTVTLGTIMA
jgi:hypothetical protein